MREVKRSALVARPASVLFGLINDIESYPAFVPGCRAARVEARTAEEIVATLLVQRGPLRAEFTTRNTLVRDRAVHMRLLRGPFRALEGTWLLEPLGASGCRIALELRFEFRNRLAAAIFDPLFEETAASLVDAFVARARALEA